MELLTRKLSIDGTTAKKTEYWWNYRKENWVLMELLQIIWVLMELVQRKLSFDWTTAKKTE